MPSPLPKSSRSKATQLWSKWQPGTPSAEGDNQDSTRGKRKGGVSLKDFDAGAKPYSLGDKAQDKAAVEALATELDTLQDVFYADKRFKLLVVLQGTDTSGKDGTLRGVFGQMSALGVHAVGWKAPSEAERARDYLWRIHQQVPQAGDITVFNRSHYEDVLVPVVNGWITPEQHAQRLAHINDFERMLSETGTVVLKFMLHISAEEQRQRLQERLDDPAKHWKYSSGDLKERAFWNDYMDAYQAAFEATNTEAAPWHVVPANKKWYARIAVQQLVLGALSDLRLEWPKAEFDVPIERELVERS